jgi:hypothetical protein
MARMPVLCKRHGGMMLLLWCVLLLSLSWAEAQPPPTQDQGYIRVVQDNGVWWFQDGAGRKFSPWA